MPALEDNLAANRGALLLVVQLVRFEIEGGEQEAMFESCPTSRVILGAFACSVTSVLSIYFTSGFATFCATSVEVNSES